MLSSSCLTFRKPLVQLLGPPKTTNKKILLLLIVSNNAQFYISLLSTFHRGWVPNNHTDETVGDTFNLHAK